MATRGVNKVIIVGNLGQDPELRYTQAGKAVVNLSVATSESWKDKQTGQPQERTEWHRVVLFDKVAEIAGEYLRKGSKVYIEGQNRTRKWQDKDGQDRYTTEIHGRDMQMLDSSNQSSPGGDGGGQGVDSSIPHPTPSPMGVGRVAIANFIPPYFGHHELVSPSQVQQ